MSQEVIFENINAKLIYNCAKQSSGSAGPSGADAEMWKRLLCSIQFNKRPAELCSTVAELARKLCVSDTKPSYLRILSNYQYLLLNLIEFQKACQGGEAAAPPELTTLELFQNLQTALKMIYTKTTLRFAFVVRIGMRKMAEKLMCGYHVLLVKNGGMLVVLVLKG